MKLISQNGSFKIQETLIREWDVNIEGTNFLATFIRAILEAFLENQNITREFDTA